MPVKFVIGYPVSSSMLRGQCLKASKDCLWDTGELAGDAELIADVGRTNDPALIDLADARLALG
jgi:hypothetical protein